ncbi:uncharacterized protein Eint_010980 [Encephalitozoon intestinalis ATCC 50506]|uniref:Uncharacterized protein n=1 Tax=Encephalitozoon intestinalis (strain ATCC 50506) TaxID=876142 RepID=E0S5H5_ENCIT|nr:uncharacterized protein Eint_010980 [Encephalitozoon intestinalis ATCC 50506]ADM10960.1 hypothetical protein Eint_010980 [Encephalitozoon intestinalis ATCC 50506]UTX44597.1 hypothetical protein GPK93_01g01070 [Encephalitozoon intestinalis]
MIGQLSLVVTLWKYVETADAGSPLYSILPSNSPLFDQGFVGPMPQVQTISAPSSKPGQLLSFAPDGGVGQQMGISPLALQPPGNIQYANVCDMSEKKEQLKKCLSEQLEKFKNILENCRKTLGENAKECCIDQKCLDVLNGGNASCNEEDGEKSCKDKKCQDKIANEILKNLNMDQLKDSLLNSLKGSLKKIGNKLGSLTSCARGEEGCNEENGISSLGAGKGIPPGVLIYPIEQSKYEAITNILDRQEKSSRQGGEESEEMQGNPSGPYNKGPSESWDKQRRPRRGRRRGRSRRYKEDASSEWKGGEDNQGSGPHSSEMAEMSCTKEMCADMDRYDSPSMKEECINYCKDYRRKKGMKADDDEKEETSELTSDSCYDEKK